MQPTKRQEAIVVGGGVFGASILFNLARAGVEALLIERGHLAEGPTGRSSANVRLHYVTTELAEIAWMGFRIMDDFANAVGGDNGFMRVGVLYGVAPDHASTFADNTQRLAAAGEPIETLTPAEMANVVPGFRLDGFALGVWEPRSGYADPVGTTLGFADAARRLGATVSVNTTTERLLVDDGRIRGVQLADRTELGADRVIVAAGPWSRALLAGVGVELPTYAERHAISLMSAADRAREVVPCVFADRVRRYYARPEGDSIVLLGGHTSRTLPVESADAVDTAVLLEESSEHVARAGPRIPELESLGIRPGYASVYDMSPDSLPIVDAVPGVKGLYVVAGTSGHGFKLAPGIGALVPDLIMSKPSALLRPFRFDRVFGLTKEISA